MRSLIALILMAASAWAQSVFPPASGGSGGSGDVTGPASSAGDQVVLFSGTSGKILKAFTSSGVLVSTSGVASTVTAPSGTIVGTTDTQTLTNKILTLPGISAYTIGTLPGSPITGSVAVVTDAASAGNCTTGSGSALSLCRWNGSAWETIGGSGSTYTAGPGISIAPPEIAVDSTTVPTFVTDTVDASGNCSAGSIWIRTDTADIWDCTSNNVWTRRQKYDANLVTAAGTLTSNAPVIGGGSKALSVGSRSGNTTEFATVSGTKTADKQVAFDASGNLVASAYDVGAAGGGSGTLTQATYSGTIDFGSIPDGGCLQSTFSASGLATGVGLTLVTELASGLFSEAWADAADTVGLRVCNISGAAVDPASATYTVAANGVEVIQQTSAPATCTAGYGLWQDTNDGGKLYRCSATNTWTEIAGGAGSGDVVGPASATDNAITRFDGTGGKTIQNSLATVDDNGSINIPTGQTYKINGTSLAASDVGAQASDAELTALAGLANTDDGIAVRNGTTIQLKILPDCSNSTTSKLLYNISTNEFSCGTDQLGEAGGGITSLGGLTAATQTFANDTNVTMTSATSTHTLGWTGTLAVSRGGTGAATTSQNYVFAGPTSGSGAPSFRALVAADVPTLNQNTTGSAATLTTARNIGGVSFNGSADIVPQTVQTVDSTDSTSYVSIFDAATGNQQPKTDAGLTYNASTGVLTATGFSGPLTGNVTGSASLNLLLTGGTLTGAVTVTGSADAIQLDVKGNATQTNPIMRVRHSDNTVLLQINNDKSVELGNGSGGTTLTEEAAPSTPASGKGNLYADSTASNLSYKNDAGTVSVAVVPQTCTNQLMRALAATGVITCSSIADADVPDTITASNYLPLAGGTMTGQLVTDNLGIEFDESDTNPTCAAGNFSIYADLSENKLKKCVNGSASDLDTTGGTASFDTLTGGTNTTATMTVGTGASVVPTGSGTIRATDVVVVDSTDSTSSVLIADSATGNLAVKTDGGLTYNASTGVLTATGFSGPLTGAVTGNASTATALAANGANCSSGSFPLGVDASGAVESCATVDSAVSSASDTTAGKVELAIASEVTTGSDTARAVTPNALRASDYGKRDIVIEIFGDATDVATGDGKYYLPIPATIAGWNIVAVQLHTGSVNSSSGAVNVDIARCAAVATGVRCSGTVADVLSTNLTVDASEDGSETAATAAVIDTANDDLPSAGHLRIDVDGAGTGTKGLQIIITVQKP